VEGTSSSLRPRTCLADTLTLPSHDTPVIAPRTATSEFTLPPSPRRAPTGGVHCAGSMARSGRLGCKSQMLKQEDRERRGSKPVKLRGLKAS